MKAKEAPEKIYVCDKTFPELVDWEGSPINTKRIDNHDIEYTPELMPLSKRHYIG